MPPDMPDDTALGDVQDETLRYVRAPLPFARSIPNKASDHLENGRGGGRGIAKHCLPIRDSDSMPDWWVC